MREVRTVPLNKTSHRLYRAKVSRELVMQLLRMKSVIGAAAAITLCISPTMASAAVAPVQSVSPLIAVSVFGTQASAQEVCGSAAGAVAAAGAAAAAQGQANCVLPVADAAPPPPVSEAPPPMVVEPSGIGIAPVILGLLGIAALAALIASSNDDSDSPVSPS